MPASHSYDQSCKKTQHINEVMEDLQGQKIRTELALDYSTSDCSWQLFSEEAAQVQQGVVGCAYTTVKVRCIKSSLCQC